MLVWQYKYVDLWSFVYTIRRNNYQGQYYTQYKLVLGSGKWRMDCRLRYRRRLNYRGDDIAISSPAGPRFRDRKVPQRLQPLNLYYQIKLVQYFMTLIIIRLFLLRNAVQ